MPAEPARRPWAVLFDLDGTLIDSIQLILDSARHAFAGYDGRVPTDDEWLAGLGIPLVTCFRPFARDEEEVQALVARYRVHQRAHHDRLTVAYPGVVETVRALHERGHPMALVTSKNDELAWRALRHVGLDAYIPVAITCDSCSRHKPEPEPVEVALRRLGYPASEAVFVGDSVHDIASGNAAGVVTVAALWGPFTHQTLAAAGPTETLPRIEELPALLERLAAGPRRRPAAVT
jgi:pyrophosphatase PpaX